MFNLLYFFLSLDHYESPEPKWYKILIKISKCYIKFYINQNGKIAGTIAISSAGKSKIAATAAILQNVIFFIKKNSNEDVCRRFS